MSNYSGRIRNSPPPMRGTHSRTPYARNDHSNYYSPKAPQPNKSRLKDLYSAKSKVLPSSPTRKDQLLLDLLNLAY
ncbi:hypothetical protein DY000_02037182 [Brassica cretica]|uniref:Uncharacterized protein n=1 Tax=Brassica cretica TaxID=69181 RepID=A0ABQ7B8S2_BRACR|nr:hypothetical protein DY000_02037182 [Brassica cretica]